MNRKTKLITALTLLTMQAGRAQQKANYTLIQSGDTEIDIIAKAANIVPSPRQLRWQQLELTTFFHFGVNTFTNREWGTGKEDPAIFNPTALDAAQWVRTVKEAGFRQVIITAKHHDGFCLWPTNTTSHSVKSSPWKAGTGDVVREVANACKKYKIGFGIYLSPWDMNASVYGSDAYNDFFVAQLTELLTQYGQVDEVWFDGANGEGPNGKKQVYDFNRYYSVIRKLQPTATIAIMGPDVRWVGTESGKGREMEWSVVPADESMLRKIADESQKDPAFAPAGDKTAQDLGSREKIRHAKGLVWYPAETDVSIRPGWFYHPKEDEKVKSPARLLDIYFSSVGYNSVLLLNIPPDKRGLLADSDVNTMKGFSQLMERTFQQNLAKGAVISAANGTNTKALLDGKYNTYFTTRGSDTTTSIELTLPGEITCNILSLQENITIGQRIEKFNAEYFDGVEWKTFAAGTTVGYKRLLRFDSIKTKKIRLNILSSRLNPTLSELGCFYLPANH
jgi:alpha-L-fucosidase